MRESVYITNIFPWYIENNKDINNNIIMKILPLLQKHIEIIEPNIIILLGNIASKSVLNTNLDISNLRGKCHEYRTINHNKIIPCIATYHPNLLLRNPEYKKKSWEDLKLIKNIFFS